MLKWNIFLSGMNKSIYSKAYKKLLEKLQKARIESGYKQREVAEKLKCSQSYVSKTENGQLRLDVIQLNEFAKLYRKDITHFLK
jgi:transcriptional regulator with XRE-family HTH domain